MSVISSSGNGYGVASPQPPAPAAIGSSGQMMRVASVSNVALINGTQQLIQWTAPQDGQPHRAIVIVKVTITNATTGGQITSQVNAGGATQLLAATQAAAKFAPPSPGAVLDPGDTISVAQQTAVTAGAGTVSAEIWAS